MFFEATSNRLKASARRLAHLGLVFCVLGSLGCATLDYQSDIALDPQASHILYASKDDITDCEFIDIIKGGAKAGNIESAVEMAMIDSRNKSIGTPGNRLIYVDTSYQSFFGVYIGITSRLYRCPTNVAIHEGEAESRANASAEAQAQRARQAAAAAAAQAAQQAQMRAVEQAHKSAIENAQRVYEQQVPQF